MTKFKERNILVPLLFLFPLFSFWRQMRPFLLVYFLYYNDGIALKFAAMGFIFAHISLYKIWISVSYLVDNSPLTNASISWPHESPVSYRSKALIKLFWNMTSTALSNKIRHRVHMHACLFSGNVDFSVRLSPTLGSHYCPAHPNSVMYHLPAFV